MSHTTKHHRTVRHGFTLIEIIVVVMIIAVLATLIAPRLMSRVGTAKQTAAISAPFILINSIAGLCVIATDNGGLPVNVSFVAPLVVAVVFGGLIGASFGSRKLGHQSLRTVLGIVLLIAAAKMFLSLSSPLNPHQNDGVKSTT